MERSPHLSGNGKLPADSNITTSQSVARGRRHPPAKKATPTGNRSRVEQDAGSRLAFEAGLDGIAEPLIDGTFLEAARF